MTFLYSDFGNVFKAKLRSTQGTVHGYRYAIKSIDLATIELEPEAHLRKCRREVQLMHACRHEVSRIIDDAMLVDVRSSC